MRMAPLTDAAGRRPANCGRGLARLDEPGGGTQGARKPGGQPPSLTLPLFPPFPHTPYHPPPPSHSFSPNPSLTLPPSVTLPLSHPLRHTPSRLRIQFRRQITDEGDDDDDNSDSDESDNGEDDSDCNSNRNLEEPLFSKALFFLESMSVSRVLYLQTSCNSKRKKTKTAFRNLI